MSNPIQAWDRLQQLAVVDPETECVIDVSRTGVGDTFISSMQNSINQAFRSMEDLERGGIANPDEQRMVGHYWLRAPERAPTKEIAQAIESTVQKIVDFAEKVHRGELQSSAGKKFRSLLLVGIGGSALGPQFVTGALTTSRDPLEFFIFDNTDPVGIERTLAAIPDLAATLCVVVSKSGSTKETRNGMVAARKAFESKGLVASKQMVAVTMESSELDKLALSEGWLARFPMFDWIGGRTSELSAVGLLPAALQGFDIRGLLDGARHMDQWTRSVDVRKNPAMMLALAWHYCGQGKGTKAMVVLPYADRLELLSRYLQQLVMESLGKEFDLRGERVHQGLSVYGNKGSTDQHAYVQQLRDGLPNFFAVFIQVLRDEPKLAKRPKKFGSSEFEVEPGITLGDYLAGFWQGTRKALWDAGRESVTITVPEVSAFTVGMLIALFERAVGFYASLIGVNAYHQPGVEAGKKAATEVLRIQKKVLDRLHAQAGTAETAGEIAVALGIPEHTEVVFHVLSRLAANKRIKASSHKEIFLRKYKVS